MPDQDEILDPSTTSSAHEAMSPVWAKIQTLLDGTGAMKAAAETYLPIHQNEGTTAYSDRLQASVLLNITALTLGSWVGRPFSDPVTISDDIPEDDQLREWFEDIDLQGNDIGVFSRNWFKEGIAKAFSHVLVDFPELENFEARTLADDSDEGVRPFFSLIKPENLIFAEAVMLEGREVLSHIRILEREKLRVGFSEAFVDRIRVFDRVIPGLTSAPIGFEFGEDIDADIVELFGEDGKGGVFVTVWRFNPESKESESDWEIERAPRRIGVDEIPLVTFYSDREDLMRGKSQLEDLSDLNIRHWQSQSDQINVLTVARFPILSATGVDLEADILEIGPKRLLASTNEKAKFGYVEHTGAAIEAGREDLHDLEEQMCQYGVDFLKKRPGTQTATARALDSAEATSPLQDDVIRFNDALQSAITIMGKWVSIEVPPSSVTVPVDFGPEEIVDGDLDTLKEARKLRDLSRPKYLAELHRRGALADDFDFKENDRELESELASFAAPKDPIDPLAEK